jgi:hypothetical protein
MAIGEMLAQDCGKRGMPTLDEYADGKRPLHLVFSADATGYGSMQFCTYGLNNPYTSKSAQNLRIIGLGNTDDGREGCRRVLGGNLEYINNLILAEERGECVDIQVGDRTVRILPNVFMVDDVSKIRHGERLANSGWCGCSRHQALRTTPPRPAADISLRDFEAYLRTHCHAHGRVERYVLSHNTLPGETTPRACTAPQCKFGHGTEPQTLALQRSLFAEEIALAAVTTKAGKTKYSKWRMAHAHEHSNVQPGAFGSPFLVHHFDKQILDPLHLAELGMPKTCWKHGILNNASDDAREQISDLLHSWKHPLDCRRKDDNRSRAQKWFTGETWATFCSGKRGSPGGPVGIAALVYIVAQDLLLRGADSGADLGVDDETVPVPKSKPPETAKAATKKGAKRRGANLANFEAANTAAANDDPMDDTAPAPEHTHIPTAIERAADDGDLDMIRKICGSRAQTIINALLAFDAYFNWYYPLKESIPFDAPMEVCERLKPEP